MYYPALKNAIQNLEEKVFYGIALMYLEQLGYRELRISDGPGDGGRDVTCSREDLRIQLSVRKDWDKKINEEAAAARQHNKRHLIYVTNRFISPDAEQEFREGKYTQKGEVDLTIADLRRIATTLARPGVIRRAYELLGMSIPNELTASPKEIAISTVLLFSKEAHELRDEVIEANLRAQLLHSSSLTESELIGRVTTAIPGVNVERSARSALSRLRTSGRIQGGATNVHLSKSELALMQAAETELLAARKLDIKILTKEFDLTGEQASQLLDLALELLVRGRDLDGAGPIEESLKGFLATHKLTRKREAVYEALARTASARVREYGHTIDQIFSTNSFDIYRALGRKTDLSMVLDASVAMPVLFGLAFGAAKSRYGVAALALKNACEAHSIQMVVPRAYLNEMAAHGQGALEKLDVYNALPAEARTSLRASENAYLSHYTHVAESLSSGGDNLSMKDFLRFFGIMPGRSLGAIENRLQTLLEQYGIKIIANARYDQEVRNRIYEKKLRDPKIVVDHDAIVATMLKNDDLRGFVFATWDSIMVELVEELARVYADTPVRVIDFLSMAAGQSFESDQSYQVLTTLLHVDERVTQRLAKKVEQINSVEQAYKLDRFVQEARLREGEGWKLRPSDVNPFIDNQEEDSTFPAMATPQEQVRK